MSTVLRPQAQPRSSHEFQILEWYDRDEATGDEDDDDDEKSPLAGKMYVMYMNGATATGESVCCRVTGFQPYFYVKMDPGFRLKRFPELLEYVKSRMRKSGLNFKDCLDTAASHLLRAKDFWGFHNNKRFVFAKLVFASKASMTYTRYIFKHPDKQLARLGLLNPRVYEGNMEPYIVFAHQTGIKLAGWVAVPSLDTSYTCVRHIERAEEAPFVQLSWDLETFSHDGDFPDPAEPRNVIFQAGLWIKSGTTQKGIVLNLGACLAFDPTDNVELICCASERELLETFAKLIKKIDPDVLYGYNTDEFDYRYLIRRLQHQDQQFYDKFMATISRVPNASAQVSLETFASKAYGTSNYTRLMIPGRLNYDLLIHYQRGLVKYSSYKLDYIAKELVGAGKHDVTPAQMFAWYKEHDKTGLRTSALYCSKDTELLQQLVDKQTILTGIMQIANVTYVPLKYLLSRGQTIKVQSQITRKANSMGCLVPHTAFHSETNAIELRRVGKPYSALWQNAHVVLTRPRALPIHGTITEQNEEGNIVITSGTELENPLIDRFTCTVSNAKTQRVLARFPVGALYPYENDGDDSFTGATVLDAETGHHQDPVLVLDYASLYPTIMMAYNLCISTFVFDPAYLGLEGVSYERHAWEDSLNIKLHKSCQVTLRTGDRVGKQCGRPATYLIDEAYVCKMHDPDKKSRKEEDKFQKEAVSYDYTVVQPSCDGVTNKGVIPALLEELYAERKTIKREMKKAKEAGDHALANILDMRQLAVKVSLNSTYGFLGRKSGNLAFKPLGMLVTYLGRQLIKRASSYASNEFRDDVFRTGQYATWNITPTSCDLTPDQALSELALLA